MIVVKKWTLDPGVFIGASLDGGRRPGFYWYLPFPFFPGILLFRKPSNNQGKPVFEKKGGKEWERSQLPEKWAIRFINW